MNTLARINAILKSDTLDTSITGLPTFHLSKLNLDPPLDFELPSNLRLGHLAEKIVSESIQSSSHFNLLYEHIQILKSSKTIGEIDFIIEEIDTKRIIHLELAYKFYLYDPNISSSPINNWIGPNRNDSLIKKLEKIKTHQFPLLYHPRTQDKLIDININEVSQELCLLASLYTPYGFKEKLDSSYEKAIKGYYLNFNTFMKLDHTSKRYYLPTKIEWGMAPAENEHWYELKDLRNQLKKHMDENQSILCWQKEETSHSSFFIVWW